MIMLFLTEGPGTPPFQLTPSSDVGGDYEFSRVPCVGEILSMGNDADGIHAAYRVVLVVHAPRGTVRRPAGAKPFDAEVYAARVDFPKAVLGAAPTAPWHSPR